MIDQEEANEYLVMLRDSGVTNMLGAGSWLESVFDVTPKEANELLLNWIESFKD